MYLVFPVIVIVLSTSTTLYNVRHVDLDITKRQRYTHKVLQTIQMKLILLCVWAEQAVLGSAKNYLKFKYEI